MGKNTTKTIVIDSDLLEWVGEQIKKKKFRNLSHAIDYALQKLKETGS